jgi:hypothetical protein
MIMKRTWVGILCFLSLVTCAWAQGSITFKNYGYTPRYPILEGDGITPLSGSAYAADLYYGPVGANPANFTSLGLAVPFLTGTGAGYFNGGDQIIPIFAAGSSVQVQIRAWRVADGSSWAAAYANPGNGGHCSAVDSWFNPVLTVTLGGAGSPPSLPATLAGMGGQQFVPEPTTVLLGFAGLGGLVLLRRKMAQ